MTAGLPSATCSEDIHEARQFLDSLGMSSTKILAKIETRQALLNFKRILATADGVVLSRQDVFFSGS